MVDKPSSTQLVSPQMSQALPISFAERQEPLEKQAVASRATVLQ
jgi:hypothetical protein